MLRVVGVWTGKPGTPWYTTMYMAGTGSTDATAAVDLFKRIVANWATVMVTGVSCTIEPFVASVNPANGDVIGGFSTDPLAPIPSSGSGTPVSSATQLQINLRTGFYVGGRAIVGKLYVPRLVSTAISADGNPTPGTQSSFASNINGELATGPDLLVWSRKNAQTYAVADANVSAKFASLRSRRD